MLIDAGVDINQGTKERHSPLMIACERNQVELSKLLLTSGADPNAIDMTGNTCVHITLATVGRDNVKRDIVDELISKGFKNLNHKN